LLHVLTDYITLKKGMYVNLSRYGVSFEDHRFLDILSFPKMT